MTSGVSRTKYITTPRIIRTTSTLAKRVWISKNRLRNKEYKERPGNFSMLDKCPVYAPSWTSPTTFPCDDKRLQPSSTWRPNSATGRICQRHKHHVTYRKANTQPNILGNALNNTVSVKSRTKNVEFWQRFTSGVPRSRYSTTPRFVVTLRFCIVQHEHYQNGFESSRIIYETKSTRNALENFSKFDKCQTDVPDYISDPCDHKRFQPHFTRRPDFSGR